jgi:hypothetical protein
MKGGSGEGDPPLMIGVTVSLIVGTGVVARELVLANQPATFTCATARVVACRDTETWITSPSDRSFVFGKPLPARLLAVEVRDATSDFVPNVGDWVTVLTMEGREPVSVACYYSSDSMVAWDDPW